MDTLRYPIGPFVSVENPSSEQYSLWIEEILKIPGLLRQTIEALTLEQLNTPYRPGGWTVQQVIHHMADNDMNAYIRFKRALTEDHPVSGSYQEDLWAELSDYSAPVELSLLLLESLHSRFAVLLRSLRPSDFQRTFTSPTHGPMNLETATHRYAWHGRHHLAQILSLKERMSW
ncbi:YfiT family bacillithiol transferase [Paenibacillus sabinae]|uniref:Metal-dependent hydrolase n=1 Tax=Paenibacillus sabinae T27 TaxID=1268072 RepID=X5A0F5_9BACL|nr:putative metal-dependent hydrolase [Paenibacillus sabinae]AHV97324.1 metal-dependent hydrolase [Paenibacillus sabinae T27]